MTKVAIPETSINQVHLNEKSISDAQKKSDSNKKCTRHVIGKVQHSKIPTQILKKIQKSLKIPEIGPWENLTSDILCCHIQFPDPGHASNLQFCCERSLSFPSHQIKITNINYFLKILFHDRHVKACHVSIPINTVIVFTMSFC